MPTKEPDRQQEIKAINYLLAIMKILILNNLEAFLYYIYTPFLYYYIHVCVCMCAYICIHFIK